MYTLDTSLKKQNKSCLNALKSCEILWNAKTNVWWICIGVTFLKTFLIILHDQTSLLHVTNFLTTTTEKGLAKQHPAFQLVQLHTSCVTIMRLTYYLMAINFLQLRQKLFKTLLVLKVHVKLDCFKTFGRFVCYCFSYLSWVCVRDTEKQ